MDDQTLLLMKRVNRIEAWLLRQGWYQEEGVWVSAMEEALSSGSEEISSVSSAPTTGLAETPYQLPGVNHDYWSTHIRRAIMDSFKSMPSMLPASEEEAWIDSSTLRLTLRWPTTSGETRAGDPGHAGHEVVQE